MKKKILFLWGFICILFFVSCSKEQLKPVTGSPSQGVTPSQTAVNGGSIPRPPKDPPPGPTFIIKKGHGHVVSNGVTANPPPPPGNGQGGSSIIQKGYGRTGLNGISYQNPPPPSPSPIKLSIIQKDRGRTGINTGSQVSPTPPTGP